MCDITSHNSCIFRSGAPKLPAHQNENTTTSIPVPKSSSNQHQETYNDAMEKPSNDNIEIDVDTTEELLSDDEMCAYEKLRMKNIVEREKLFQDLKISQMK